MSNSEISKRNRNNILLLREKEMLWKMLHTVMLNFYFLRQNFWDHIWEAEKIGSWFDRKVDGDV